MSTRPCLEFPDLPSERSEAMEIFMVERSLPGIAMQALAAAQQRAIATAEELSKQGTPIRYLRTTFVPQSGCCMCLFEAESAEAVKRLNQAAQIPFDTVVPALDLTPQQDSPDGQGGAGLLPRGAAVRAGFA